MGLKRQKFYTTELKNNLALSLLLWAYLWIIIRLQPLQHDSAVAPMTMGVEKNNAMWLLWRQRHHRHCRRRSRSRNRSRNFVSRRWYCRRQSRGRWYTRAGRTRAKASHWNGTALRRRHGTEKKHTYTLLSSPKG